MRRREVRFSLTDVPKQNISPLIDIVETAATVTNTVWHICQNKQL